MLECMAEAEGLLMQSGNCHKGQHLNTLDMGSIKSVAHCFLHEQETARPNTGQSHVCLSQLTCKDCDMGHKQ